MSEADKIIKNLKNSGKKVEEFYVSNKTSDKNVANIEEAIKILEKDLFYYDEIKENFDDDTIKFYEALRHILSDYTRQKQINEEHQKLNGELRQAINTVEKEKGDWIKAYQEEKDKQIDLMAKCIDVELSSARLGILLNKDVKPLETYKGDIKQYFERKAENEK